MEEATIAGERLLALSVTSGSFRDGATSESSDVSCSEMKAASVPGCPAALCRVAHVITHSSFADMGELAHVKAFGSRGRHVTQQ